MQFTTYKHPNQQPRFSLKTQNQNVGHRRDGIKHRALRDAVHEWELTLPGQAQEKIALTCSPLINTPRC